MTDRVDLEAIEARLAAATPGDWTVSEGDGYGVGTNVVAPRPDMGVGVNGAVAHDVFHMPDADLIAHAPSDLAACVAEIRALREVVVGAAETVSQGFLDPLLEVFAEYDEAMGE